MNQVTIPNLRVDAIRGWCLLYVDDAGGCPKSMPPRTRTARIAFNNENNAGRISTGDIPVGVWVVGFLDFTSGPSTREGHVFFIKNHGNRQEIWDSEVATGARLSYGSIAELKAWFGAYKPTYIGWSTQCDGVIYAKEDKMSKASEQEIGYFYRAILGREGSDKEIKAYLGQEYEAIVRDMISFTFFNGYDYATFRRNRDEDLRRAETDRDKWKSEAESAAKQPMSEGEAVRILKDLSNAFNAVANVTK